MLKTILKTSLIIILSLFMTSTMSMSAMKCVGALTIHDDEDMRDSREELKYLYPCIDQQDNPQKVMMLQINQKSYMSERTVYVYTIQNLMKACLENVEPDFTYPQPKSHKIVSPAFYSGYKNTPFCFQQGLYYLVKTTNNLWAIYHDDQINNPIYSEPVYPWFFQKYGNTLAYSIKNRIVCSNQTLDRIQYEIISFDIPDQNHKLICYYNEHNNPDIVLKKSHRRDVVIQTAVSELYPKFSTNREYFAYYRNRQNAQDTWDIIVCPTNSPNSITEIIPNIRMYDIRDTAFLYKDSFQWMDNRLYYIKHEAPFTIFEYTPPHTHREILLTGNSFQKKIQKFDPIGTKTKNDELELIIDLVSTDWFQVAQKNGALMFVVECLIKTRCPSNPTTNEFENQVKRILLFQ